jgi:pimeloyl-ACP methyl ester carboxylesterase
MQFVYFHGQPGSPDELQLAGPKAFAGAALYAPDRARDRPDLAIGPYLDHLTQAVLACYPDGSIRLIGFSMGAFIAAEVALRLIELAPDRTVSLDLVSPAAPLGLGDFLPHMAGGSVFALARDKPRLFALATSVQGWLARTAPGFLFAQVFARPAGADADLVRTPAFRSMILEVLKHATARGARGYRREMLAYVAQDPARLRGLTWPVRLWQGEADNWTPPAMAEALAAILPEVRAFRRYASLSHYSTLKAALPEIIAGGG